MAVLEVTGWNAAFGKKKIKDLGIDVRVLAFLDGDAPSLSFSMCPENRAPGEYGTFEIQGIEDIMQLIHFCNNALILYIDGELQ